MSLDTVLQIGKTLRSSNEGLRYFQYIKQCPSDTDKETILRLNIPVNEDMTFDWNNVQLVPENQIKNLFYLTFKTSDSDGLVKYLFGDIYFELNSKVNNNGNIENKEGGFYRLPNEDAHGLYQKSSFHRASEDFQNIKQDYNNKYPGNNADDWILTKFRESFYENEYIFQRILRYIPALKVYFSNNQYVNFKEFLENKELIKNYFLKNVIETKSKNIEKAFGENFDANDPDHANYEKLKKLGSGKIFLHFDFNGEHWYNFHSELDLITEKMLGDFFENDKNEYVLKKTLYKNLCSGDKKNDMQFPGLMNSSKYKSKSFSENEAKDLFYAKEYSEKALFYIKSTDIKLIVLPRGDNLQASDYTEFLEKANEKRINSVNNKISDEDPILSPLAIQENNEITSFDFIFSKKGGLTSPDKDLIEVSGIEKSTLKATMDQINTIGKEISEKYGYQYKPKIEQSFLNILGSAQVDNKGKLIFKANPKYQSHVLKVLPQIYTQSCYHDNILLPALIEKVEFAIRNTDQNNTGWYFNNLKYHFEFLLSIQNNQNNKFMEITNSKSYQSGLLLGSLAKDLRNRINSFEKNYVGNLTRRISTLKDCVKFKNEIEQKNIMHELSHLKRSTSNDLSELLRDMEESEYDKEEVAFGFFESYFRYETKKGFMEKLEKLLSDFSSSEEEDSPLIQSINESLQNYQNQES